MDKLSATRCGMVDSVLAYAARHTVATIAAPGLIVLDDVHLRMGIAYTATGAVPASYRPSDKWVQLMRDLFRFDHYERWPPELDSRPAWLPPVRGVRGLMTTVPDAQRRALRSVMSYAACFLMGEAMIAEDQIALAARVHRGQRRPFALVPDDATGAIRRTARWGAMALLRRLEVEGGPLLLAPEKDQYFRQPCRATRWEAPCDIIHPRTPACPPPQRTRSPADA